MKLLRLLPLLFFASAVHAQMMRPPAFAGGVPGMAQFQALTVQRHQARTLLYREALEELRRNPAAADVPECPPGALPKETLCLARPVAPIAAPAPGTEPAAGEVAITPAATVAAAPASLPPVVVPEEPKPVAVAPPPVVQRRVALLVGNNDYTAPIPGLETPVADVEKIAAVLRSRFGYEARVLRNASKAQIIEAFNEVAAGVAPEDSVLLFYAGHGYLMDDTNMGFWIPVDASVKTAANWISNTDISRLLAAVPARQIILVSDSCFSGSLTREQKVSYRGEPKADEVLRRRSVLVFSSGGDEPVSDEGKDGHSIFAWNLIKTLDTSTGTTPGYEVWRSVSRRVTSEFPQEPQYGAVVSAGHVEGGEYLFQTK
ncbi:caspase family protein [Rhodocyclus purpureus]|uniref:caspase family protein n=1 Tax=Rhodocyclus purpureus TaxID=1067 RepID=UPI0019127FA7|nr:caspase family protein [Rhodocyclus purpureus]MBK5915652.1 hypothetical protein [Rhodocyclus purpureus]